MYMAYKGKYKPTRPDKYQGDPTKSPIAVFGRENV